MMDAWMAGSTGKFISATHIGIASNPGSGAAGANADASPIASTASASCPRRSIIVVKSYLIGIILVFNRLLPRLLSVRIKKFFLFFCNAIFNFTIAKWKVKMGA